MKYLKIFLFFLITCCFNIIVSQNDTLKSLKLGLKNSNHDTSTCKILLQLINLTYDNEQLIYCDQLLLLSDKNLSKKEKNTNEYKTYLKFKALAMNYKGQLYYLQADYTNALNYYIKSLKIMQEINDKIDIALLYNNLGVLFASEGNIIKAIEYFTSSLKAREYLNDQVGISECLNNLGYVYENLQDYEKAIDYYNRSLKISLQINDTINIYSVYINIGNMFFLKTNYPTALENYNNALKICEKFNIKQGMSTLYENIGNVYSAQGNYIKASDYLAKSLKNCLEVNDKTGAAHILCSMGTVNAKLGNDQLAIKYFKESLKISKETNSPEFIKNSAFHLYTFFKITNPKLALENYELYIKMSDSISNQETRKASIKSELKYEYEKKAAADSVKVAEEKKLTNIKLKQEKVQRYYLYTGLSLVGIFAIFMFNRFRVTNKQKKLIEEQKKIVEHQKELVDEKQKEILDSITYAKKIQQAMLPNINYLKKNIKT